MRVIAVAQIMHVKNCFVLFTKTMIFQYASDLKSEPKIGKFHVLIIEPLQSYYTKVKT